MKKLEPSKSRIVLNKKFEYLCFVNEPYIECSLFQKNEEKQIRNKYIR